MDYIENEKDYYQQFLTKPIDSYIKTQRKEGVWGDNYEIQAASE